MENKLVYNNKAIVEVTKEFTFESCHKLLEYVGACANLHGHSYKLQVTLKGSLDNIGMVLDFKTLKRIVEDCLIDVLDHAYLNDLMTYNTTAENMVVAMFDTLTERINRVAKTEGRYIVVTKVRLWETATSFATYEGQALRGEI